MRTACPRLRRPVACVACALAFLASTLAGVLGCALEDGERFGRPGTQPGVLRVHVREPVVELDPARARTPLERAIARQLFSALVESSAASGANDAPAASLASSWSQPSPGRIVLVLRDDARFSDGQPLTAHDVVWSWRRALRTSTGAADRRLSATIKNGAELAAGTLLRIVAAEPVRARGPPYAVFLDDTTRDRAGSSSSGAGDPAGPAFVPGTAVRVVDTNTRTPAGEPVPLSRAPEGGAAASSLARGEVATVIALVEVPASKGQPARTMLQLRAPDGAAGWASDDVLSRHVPTIGVVPVVHRGGDAPVLRAGPDAMAPTRATLGDESAVEVLERGTPFSLVVDVASGKTGFLDSALLEDTARERRWFFVEQVPASDAPSSTTRVRGWISERDLAFDPGLLDVVAVDGHTLEIGLAVDVDRALAAFADAAFRPVPARVVEEHGRAWTRAGTIVTSGPFTLAPEGPQHGGRDDDGTALVLVRSPMSFEAARARLSRIELIYVERPTSALHLYRAGLIDVLLDGALPPELAPALARAADWHAGAQGGALIAPEVVGLSASALELRDVHVGAP